MEFWVNTKRENKEGKPWGNGSIRCLDKFLKIYKVWIRFGLPNVKENSTRLSAHSTLTDHSKKENMGTKVWEIQEKFTFITINIEITSHTIIKEKLNTN